MGAIQTALDAGLDFYDKSKKTIDLINKEGYGWFMHFLRHPVATRDEYIKRYTGKNPRLRLVGAVLWRLPLMIVPVLPALTIVTRLAGVILNPNAWATNFTKPASMVALLGAAALAISFPYRQFVMHGHFIDSARLLTDWLPFVVNQTLQAPMAIGIMVWGGVLVGAALMYAGKHLGEMINQYFYGTTTLKHVITNPANAVGIKPLDDKIVQLHKAVRDKHQALKNQLDLDPNSIAFNLNTGDKTGMINECQVTDPMMAADQTIILGKKLLNNLEEVLTLQKNTGSVPVKLAQNVLVPTGNNSTLLHQWQSAINVVSENKFDLSDYRFDYDTEKSKVIVAKP